MSVDWPGLFDALRVPWRDRGKNTSRTNTNICCPFCRDDDGYHLGVSNDKEAFYCFRRPDVHSGNNLVRLLMKLNVSRLEAIRLLNEYQGVQSAKVVAFVAPLSDIAKAWDRFESAELSANAKLYLAGRGFDNPGATASRYDLRIASLGTWAQRLLLPFMLEGQLRSWTGRALRSHLTPKYLNKETGQQGLIYMPRPARDVVVICEGPLDALKIAAGSESMPVSALALTGKQLNDIRLWNVRQAVGNATTILLCLDSDTSMAETSRMIGELRGGLIGKNVRRIRLPTEEKDPGGIHSLDIQEWLMRFI